MPRAVKKKTRQEAAQAAYDEIRQWTNDTYAASDAVLGEIAGKYGVEKSDIDTSEFADDEETENDDEENESETNDLLDDLQDAQDELETANTERENADKLKTDKTQPLKATQQKAADELQRNLANVQDLQHATIGNVRQKVNAVSDKIGSMATPGGLMAPLTLLILLVVFLVNVQDINGESFPRFVWSWLVLTRKARLIPETAIPEKIYNPPEKQTQNTQQTNDIVDSIIIMPQLNSSQFSRYFTE